MSAGATTERVLTALRHRLVEADLRPGDRLDPAMLAREVSASSTPVREALHVLTGEGLVETRSGGGFNLPFLDDAGLQDRYAWSGQLVAQAIHAWPRRRRGAQRALELTESLGTAERTAALFLGVAHTSHNGEHARQIGLLNSRMHRIRLAEAEILPDLDCEMTEIIETIESCERSEILRRFHLYHKKRRKMSSDILRVIYNRN